jgi:formiminoglutamase
MLMKKAFLKYFIFGLHENYTSKVLDLIKKTDDRVRYNTYDSIGIRKEKEFSKRCGRCP